MAKYEVKNGETSDGIILENDTMTAINGGVQVVLDLQAAPRQIIYLDFDGELTKYRNADLDLEINNVQVEDSMLTSDRIAGIVARLNTDFSVYNVIFTSERPKDAAYSTIFVGKTSAFDQYGQFAGLAETVDLGNQRKDDNAFVLLDASNSDSDIVSTIAHEAGHIIGTIDHGGDALYRYAATTYYYIQNNCTITDHLYYSANYYAPDDHSDCHFYLVHYASDREYVSSSWNYDNTNSYECVSSRYDKAASLPVNPTEVLHVSSNCLASNIQINGYSSWRGALLISRGGSSVDVRTFSSSYIEVRGVAINTTVNSEGLLLILSGGTAKTTTVNKGANLNISSGGSATAVRENGGYVHVSSGAHADFVENTFSGMYFSNGQSASLHSATTAIKAYVNNAGIDVLGGTAISASISTSGSLYVYNGGVASSTQIYNSGVMCVSSGGKADNTAVNYAGSMCLYNGGKANVTVISGGSFHVYSGGTANDTTLSGQMGIMHVYGGGTANVTVISGGSLYVSSGGIANDTVISGGRLFVYNGGKASVTTVNSSGSFYIYSGGTATGQMKFYKGAVVSAASGAIIDFNISEIATGFTARVNDLSVVSGRDKADYTITVSNNQAKGVYVLAKGASDFNKTISVVGTSGETLGTLAIGNAVKINGTDYVLNLKDDVLSVRIGDWEPAKIDYAFTDIGQTVYYDGEKPEDCELEGVLMEIPYTADITISFDKSLGFGEYEFTTSVAEVPGSVNTCRLQISDAEGIPDLNGENNPWSVAYLSDRDKVCILGTKIGETDTTVTYKFTNVNDYLLINAIPEDTLNIGITRGTTNYSDVTYQGSSQSYSFVSEDHSDVNKELTVEYLVGIGDMADGYMIDYEIKRRESEPEVYITDGDKNRYQYYADYVISVVVGEEVVEQSFDYLEVTEDADSIVFTMKPDSMTNTSVSIAVDKETMTIASIDGVTYSYGDQKVPKDFAPWDYNYCWLATACNMLYAAGYLAEDLSAEKCYELLKKRFFFEQGYKSYGGNEVNVFKALNWLIYKCLDFSTYSFSLRKIYNKIHKLFDVNNIGIGLENLDAGKGNIVGSIGFTDDAGMNHVITCYEYNIVNENNGYIIYADSDDPVDNKKAKDIKTARVFREGLRWYISMYYTDSLNSETGSWHKYRITDVNTLIHNTPNGVRFTENDFDRMIIIGKSEDNKALVVAGKYAGAFVSDDGNITISESIYDSVVMEDGVLSIASGAEAEEMIVHGGGTVNFNSGSIAKGTIRTAGGTLTVESGVNVSEAEFDFDISDMENGSSALLLNSLDNVSGSKLTITIVNGQSDGKYVLAGGAADFDGTLSVVGEYDYTQDIGEGFKNGLIGELGLDNALFIEGKHYFLTLEEDDLVLMISSEGVSDIVVPSGGARVVSSGQVYIDTIVNSDGSMVVSSGGTVNNITLNPGGGLYVSGGGKMTGRMVLSSGAIVSAYDGAIVDFDLTQTSAGAASAIINDLSVVKGRPVFTLTVDGTQANGAYKLAEGVSSGFGRTITIQNASGDLLGTVSVGETTRIADSDFTLVLSGSTHTLSLGINVDIIPPTVTNVTANTSELTSRSVTVTAEFADNVAIASAFYRIGETGPWTAYENGVTVSQNATIYFKAVDTSGNESEIVSYPVTNIINHTVVSGGVTQNNIHVSSGQMYYNTVLNGGFMYVSSGGIANSTTLNSNGRIYLYGGGAIYNTTAGSGCWINVSSGGILHKTMLSGGGLIYLSGGIMNNTTLSCGTVSVFSGGVANSADIYSSGHLIVSSGGVANSVIVYQSGQLYVQSESIANDTVLQGGVLFVASDGTANSTTANSGGWIIIQKGGIGNYTMLTSGGSLLASSGGTANNTTVKAGGYLYFSSGGVVNDTTVSSGGRMTIYSAGMANDTTIYSGGSVTIYSSGAANDTTVSSGGTLNVYGSGVVNSTTVKEGGNLNVYSGGTATIAFTPWQGSIVSSSGAQITYLERDANIYYEDPNRLLKKCSILNSMVLNSGCRAVAYSNGVLNDTTVSSGGTLFVSSGGTANGLVISSGGTLVVSSGGTAYNISIFSGCTYSIKTGATASGFNINSGVNFNVRNMPVRDTVINFGGRTFVSSGGVIDNTVVNSGGSLYLSSGGKLTGQTTIENGAIVSAYEGTIVDFDISGVGPSDTPLINNLSLLHGTPTYTLTVDSMQPEGAYNLAESVGGFSRTITVKNTLGQELDTLTVGAAKDIGGMSFTLNLSGDELSVTIASLSVTDNVAPVLSSIHADITEPTNQDVTVTVEFTDNVGVAQILYKIGENGQWTAYVDGVTVSDNLTVYFKAVDTSGNESAEAFYKVANIDRTPPAKPTASADVTAPTNGSVTVTATFSEDSALCEYSYDNNQWQAYQEAIKFSENGTVFFRSIDEAGNISETTSYEVANIDKSEPGKEDHEFLLGDFDGNGKAMLATQKDGAVRIYSNGAEWGNGLALDPGWELVGVGDFNGDKKDDFLRVNTEGYVVGEMSQGDGTFAAQVLNLKSAGWSILGTGDFNHNGTDDILIANPTAASATVGLLGYWESGVTWTLINGYSPEWECVSTGDFNGDGKSDMLWRNSFVGEGDLTYNAFCTWIVDPPEGQSDWRMVSVANPDEWSFLCSGDFDGDKMNDIAMINDVGVVGIWGVNDGYLNSWSILSAVSSEWTFAGVGDFDGDGTDDIAWCNTDTGLVGCWQIANKELASWQTLATIA